MKIITNFLAVTILAVLAILVVGTSAVASTSEDFRNLRKILIESEKLYTTYNMRYNRGSVYSVNYQAHRILPAGTEIVKVVLNPDEGETWTYNMKGYSRENKTTSAREGAGFNKEVFFYTVDGKKYRLKYHNRHSRKSSIWAFTNKMFSEKSPKELFSGMDDETISAIKAGQVLEGMTMDEVIMTMGIPFDGLTPEPKNDLTWYYWTTRHRKKEFCFDENKLAIGCGDEVLAKKKRHTAPIKTPMSDMQKKEVLTGDIEKKMESLKRMLDKGLITEEDYSQKKNELLEEM